MQETTNHPLPTLPPTPPVTRAAAAHSGVLLHGLLLAGPRPSTKKPKTSHHRLPIEAGLVFTPEEGVIAGDALLLGGPSPPTSPSSEAPRRPRAAAVNAAHKIGSTSWHGAPAENANDTSFQAPQWVAALVRQHRGDLAGIPKGGFTPAAARTPEAQTAIACCMSEVMRGLVPQDAEAANTRYVRAYEPNPLAACAAKLAVATTSREARVTSQAILATALSQGEANRMLQQEAANLGKFTAAEG